MRLEGPQPSRRASCFRATGRLLFGLALCGLLTSCGLAESVVEGFVDDQDVTVQANMSLSGTLVRDAGGTDLLAVGGVLHPGDTLTNERALAVLAFSIAPSLQPSRTRLETVRLRFWVEPRSGDVTPLGPILVSRLPSHPEAPLAVGQVPEPPGNDIVTIADTTTSGWREVDVTSHFLADWNQGKTISAYAVRFTSASDGGLDADDVDLDPDVGGQVQRAHLVLHFGVDL